MLLSYHDLKINNDFKTYELDTKEFKDFHFYLQRAIVMRRPILVLMSTILFMILIALIEIICAIRAWFLVLFSAKSSETLAKTQRDLSVFMFIKINS